MHVFTYVLVLEEGNVFTFPVRYHIIFGLVLQENDYAFDRTYMYVNVLKQTKQGSLQQYTLTVLC